MNRMKTEMFHEDGHQICISTIKVPNESKFLDALFGLHELREYETKVFLKREDGSLNYGFSLEDCPYSTPEEAALGHEVMCKLMTSKGFSLLS